MVNVFEREILYLIKDVVAQVLGVSGTCDCCHVTSLNTKEQGKHSHDYKNQTALQNVGHISICDSYIDDFGHLEWNQNFHQNFENDKKRSKNGLLLIFSY